MDTKRRRLESTIKKNILKWLNEIEGGRAISLHGSRFGVVGTPDILFIYRGRAFFFEVKREGEDARPNQRAELAKWERAGAAAAVVHSLDEVKATLKTNGG